MEQEKKKTLRKWIGQLKAQYTDNELKELSVNVLAKVEENPLFAKAKTVLLYHSLKDEVYTHLFIEKWSLQKKILLPVVVGDELELRIYTGPNDLGIGKYSISEPIGETFAQYELIDLVIVPGVAFDQKGNRLGRGKGYYDKLLPHINAPKLGLCFPFQRVEEVPTESLDIPMNAVISQ